MGRSFNFTRRHFAKGGRFRVTDTQVTKKSFRKNGTHGVVTHVAADLRGIIGSGLVAALGDPSGSSAKSTLISTIAETMLEIWRNDGAAFGAPAWETASDSKIGNKLMVETGYAVQMLRISAGGAKTGGALDLYPSTIKGNVAQWEVGWSTDIHPGDGELSLADIMALHEFGFRVGGKKVRPRPWLSRAMLVLYDELGDDIVAKIDESGAKAAAALLAAQMMATHSRSI